MGAGASVKEVYGEAIRWFREYFDTDLYVEDFRNIDKDQDGGITYVELRKWIQNKAINGDKAWKTVMSNQQVMTIAHRQASKYSSLAGVALANQKIVDVADFKSFLLQLFSISLMWTHFKNADSWEEGHDAGNDTLNLAEFRLAIKSFCLSQANEEITEEQILKDFNTLDANHNGSITFIEVCNYCCQFVDPKRAEMLFQDNKPITRQSQEDQLVKMIEDHNWNVVVEERLKTSGNLSEEVRLIHMSETALDKNTVAIDALAEQMAKNAAIAEFVNIKANTEVALGILVAHQPTHAEHVVDFTESPGHPSASVKGTEGSELLNDMETYKPSKEDGDLGVIDTQVLPPPQLSPRRSPRPAEAQ